jgi:hypothetical protein
MRAILGADPLFLPEFFWYFSGYLDLEVCGVEAGNPADAASAAASGRPKTLPSNTVGADGADSCDNRAPRHQVFAFDRAVSIG